MQQLGAAEAPLSGIPRPDGGLTGSREAWLVMEGRQQHWRLRRPLSRWPEAL